jgi:hypothetical protein
MTGSQRWLPVIFIKTESALRRLASSIFALTENLRKVNQF